MRDLGMYAWVRKERVRGSVHCGFAILRHITSGRFLLPTNVCLGTTKTCIVFSWSRRNILGEITTWWVGRLHGAVDTTEKWIVCLFVCTRTFGSSRAEFIRCSVFGRVGIGVRILARTVNDKRFSCLGLGLLWF